MQPLPRFQYEERNVTPKTPYAYWDRRLFAKCAFKRKVAASNQQGISEEYYFDVNGFADNDTYHVYKNATVKYESYALDNLAFETLQDHKMPTGIARMHACFRVRYFWLILAYCDYDTLLTAALMEGGGMTSYMASVAEVVHMSVDEVGKYGVSRLIFSLFCRIAASRGFTIEKDVPASPKTLEGAKVFEPFAQILGNVVTTLDYKSLYPSQMLARNLCVTTVMRPLNSALEPVEFDWRKPQQCAVQLREWDVIRERLYGPPFVPAAFAAMSAADQQIFRFLYPMSSSVSVRVNQNAQADDYLGPFLKQPPKDAEGNNNNKQAAPVRDVAPVMDFLIDRPQFYADGARRGMEEARGVIVIMQDEVLLKARAAVKTAMAAVKRAHYDAASDTWKSNEAKARYKALDQQQAALKMICNGTYGYVAMGGGKVSYSWPAIATTYFSRMTIKFTALMTLAGWTPAAADDFAFMQRQYRLVAENRDKFTLAAKDKAATLLARGMPSRPEEGDQTREPGWVLPQTEAGLDAALKTLKSRWGISVVYGDTDSIMVSIWFVLCCTPNAEGRLWHDSETRGSQMNITRHMAKYICDIFVRHHMGSLELAWEKIYEPYIALRVKKMYSGLLYDSNPAYHVEISLKSMKKRDVPWYILVMVKRCLQYMCEDLCGVRVVPYVKRTLLALARSGGKPSFPGLLTMCIRNQAINKADYKSNTPAHVLANQRVARRFSGYQHGPGERVDWVSAYRPERGVAKSEKGVTIRELELMLERAEMEGGAADSPDFDIDRHLRIADFGNQPLRLDLEDLFDKFETQLGKIFDSCLRSECRADYAKIVNSPSASVRLSDGRVVVRDEVMDAKRLTDMMRRVFERQVTNPDAQITRLFARAPSAAPSLRVVEEEIADAPSGTVPTAMEDVRPVTPPVENEAASPKKREGAPLPDAALPAAKKKKAAGSVAAKKVAPPPARPITDFFAKHASPASE